MNPVFRPIVHPFSKPFHSTIPKSVAVLGGAAVGYLVLTPGPAVDEGDSVSIEWFDTSDPQGTLVISDNTPDEGDSVTLEFEPVTYTYQWKKDGVNIGGATSNPLNLGVVDPSDDGDYTVVVTNSITSVAKTFGPESLEVTPAPFGVAYADPFTDTNGTRLDDHSTAMVWEEVNGVWEVNSNAARCVSTTFRWCFAYDAGHESVHHYVQADIASVGSGVDGIGVIARANIAGGGYIAYRNTGTVTLYKIDLVSNAATSLDSVVAAGSGGTLKLEARGTKLTVWLDGVEQIVVYDSTYTDGLRCGIVSWPSAASYPAVDNYAASDIIPALYTLTSVTVSGQDANLYIPGSFTSGVAIIYCHANNGTKTEPVLYDVMTNTQAMLTNGWMIAASDLHFNNWGNDDSKADVLALHDYLVANYGITKTVLVAQSMGGVVSLLMAAAGTLTTLRGWAGVVPVCSLSNMYGANANPPYSELIEAAYGIAADGSDYAALTAGHDPVLLSGSAFTGLPMRFYASASDTVVNKAANSTAMAALVNGFATENVVVNHTGDHADVTAYQPDDICDFIDRCIA